MRSIQSHFIRFQVYVSESQSNNTRFYFQPIQVLIVAYQRTGSSFLGELFNEHDSSFYWYEPVDGVYASLYGTSHGWTVPSDIYNNKDGLKRCFNFLCIYSCHPNGIFM